MLMGGSWPRRTNARALAAAMLLLALSPSPSIAQSPAPAQTQAQVPAQAAAPPLEQTACKAAHDAYRAARTKFAAIDDAYWQLVSRKRSYRRTKAKAGKPLIRADYVLNFPPQFPGPQAPDCKLPEPPQTPPVTPPAAATPLPQVTDFLAAARKQYRFIPRRISEKGFKLEFAKAALAAGLTGEQVVGVYALETGGIGPYARQSGIFITDETCRARKPRGKPASTALGYVQLLAANSSVVIAANGLAFAGQLLARAKSAKGARAARLKRKALILRRMVRDLNRAVSRHGNRNGWREFVAYGKTARGRAIHAANLDADIGPLMQVYKLVRIKEAAAEKGFTAINAAQMELLNLVGYGRGIEMLGPAAVNVPAANFFSQGAYDANPVAKGQTAKGLLDKIAAIITRQLTKCGSREFTDIFRAAQSGAQQAGQRGTQQTGQPAAKQAVKRP